MSLCHSTVFLIKVDSTFTLDQVGDFFMADIIVYQHLIGKLIYLSCKTKPDIAFVIGQFSCHNSDSQAKYLCSAKQNL